MTSNLRDQARSCLEAADDNLSHDIEALELARAQALTLLDIAEHLCTLTSAVQALAARGGGDQ